MANTKFWNVWAVNGIKNDLWLTADKEVLPLTGTKARITMGSQQETKIFYLLFLGLKAAKKKASPPEADWLKFYFRLRNTF
jgi:hypothetical protein